MGLRRHLKAPRSIRRAFVPRLSSARIRRSADTRAAISCGFDRHQLVLYIMQLHYRMLKADGSDTETEQPINDLIDIGFSGSGEKEKPLYLQNNASTRTVRSSSDRCQAVKLQVCFTAHLHQTKAGNFVCTQVEWHYAVEQNIVKKDAQQRGNEQRSA
jgi:hypothetical protein